jgi:3D (Asp-Asp-Asp) domain-containing protein
LAITGLIPLKMKIDANTNPSNWISDGKMHEVECTAYYNPNGNLTASGAETIEGVTIAGAREWLGCLCVMWDENKNYLGTYEFTDTGYGRDGDILRGETVDVFMQSRSDCVTWGRQKVYIQVIRAEG